MIIINVWNLYYKENLIMTANFKIFFIFFNERIFLIYSMKWKDENKKTNNLSKQYYNFKKGLHSTDHNFHLDIVTIA